MIKTIAVIILLLLSSSVPEKELTITNITFTPLDIESNDIDILEEAANIYISEGLYSEAIPFLEKLISLKGEDICYCSKLSTCLLSIDDKKALHML